MRFQFLLYIVFTFTSMHLFSQDEEVLEPASEQEDIKLIDKFASDIRGTFSSKSQAESDSDYYNISLVMFPIWEDDTDAKWFYVEQALDSMKDKPYRQRVYKVYQSGPKTIVSAIYELKSPKKFIKLQESRKKIRSLSKKDIVYKEGCDVILQYNGEFFEGGTIGKKCSSKMRGARYATTEVSVHSDRLISWDRGFTGSGVHAWGAIKGGYIFEKEGE